MFQRLDIRSQHAGITRGKSFDFTALLIGVVCAIVTPLIKAHLFSFESLPGHPRSDFEYYFYPLHCFLRRSIADGTIPFWNPHLFCGYPVVETVQSALLYPFHALALLTAPSAVHTVVCLTVFHFVMNYGTWYWCLRYAFSFAPAISALVSALPNVTSVMPYRFFGGHLTVIFTLPWFPVLIGAAYRLANDLRMVPWLAVAGVSLGFVVLAGAPQYALFGAWSFLAVSCAASRTSHLPRTLLRTLSALALGAVVASPQLVATAAYVPFSARSGLWGTLSFRAATWTTIIETLLAAPFGNGVNECHINERGPWDTAGYIGTLTIVLAVFGFLVTKQRGAESTRIPKSAFSLVVLGFYLMAGGWLPGFERMRENQRAIFIIHTGLFLAVALGLRELLSSRVEWKDFSLPSRRFMVLLLAALCLSYSMRSVFRAEFPAFWSWFCRNCVGVINLSGYEQVENASIVWNSFHRALNWAIAWLTIACALAMAYRWLKTWSVIAIAGLALVDPLLFHLPAYETRTSVATMGLPPAIRHPLNELLSSRQLQRLSPARVVFPSSLTNAAQCLEGIGETGGYDPLMPLLALARRNYTERPLTLEERKHQQYDIFGIEAEIYEPFSQPEFVPPQKRVMQLRHLRQNHRASMTTLTRTFQIQPAGYLFGPIENTTHTVERVDQLETILSWCSDVNATASGMATNAPVLLKWYGFSRPNSIRLLCLTPHNSVLVVSSTWLPWWRIRDDSSRISKTFRVNGWMTGVCVPAGISLLELVYAPPAWRHTVFAMFCGILAVVAVGILPKYQPRQPTVGR